ncbi:MAG: hypothetical protein E7255_05940 [Lachnospiraceae bacterium]|nr:hypothetical protein [Lachnospiraceae bacterium]
MKQPGLMQLKVWLGCDTNSLEDKAIIAQEIEEYQSMIDNICKQTEYNTMHIFENHQDTYYSIEGSKQWDPAQIQVIEEPDNDLIIYLPDEYVPSTYQIHVPSGVYTTQELVDEIDTAFENMVPKNPGFIFEYTEDGYCNLNFEGGTDVKSVEGYLSGLIYGRNDGSGYGRLVGTTQFEAGWPLSIESGKNDTIIFYTEAADGTDSRKISLTIPSGSYTREELINRINNTLSEQDLEGIVAKEYGEKAIQLSAGSNVVTGLKGNMFAIDEGKAYTSIFYDNVKSGNSTMTPASIRGKAYYSESSGTSKIVIGSDNNKLRFSVNNLDYQQITIDDGEYTIKELTDQLNEKLDGTGLIASAETVNAKIPGTTGYAAYNYLKLTSTLEGSASTLSFDTGSDLFRNTYEALFCDTTVSSVDSPDLYSGVTVDPSLTGAKSLSGEINLTKGATSLNLTVNGDKYSLNLSKTSYSSFDDLILEINSQISNAGIGIKDKIQAQTYGNQIQFVAIDDSIDSIQFNPINKGSAYQELFQDSEEEIEYFNKANYGAEEWAEGSTKPTELKPASVNLGHTLSSSIAINDSNNEFNIIVNGEMKSIRLTNGTYSRSQLVGEINKQFSKNNIKVTASLESNGSLTFTTLKKGSSANLNISSNSGGSAMKVFVGTYIHTTNAASTNRKITTSYIQGKSVTFPLTLNSTNKNLDFIYEVDGESKDLNIDLPEGEYSAASLKTVLQSAIDSQIGDNQLFVKVDEKGVRIEAVNAGDKYSLTGFTGGFYQYVLSKREEVSSTDTPRLQQGTHSFHDAYVVGRQDLRNQETEIVKDRNDKFIMDFTYVDPSDASNTFELELSVIIEPGVYQGDALAQYLEEKLNAELISHGIDNVRIESAIGGINTGVVGAVDDNAIHFTLKEVEGKEANKGKYTLDGIRGNSAYSIFYKSIGTPEAAYIQGSKNIEEGIVFTEDANTFKFTTEGTNYSYSFPAGEYTAEELIDMFNQKFADGDDNDNIVKLHATLVGGNIKIQHDIFGERGIENIDGTAKEIIFYNEVGREDLEDLSLQVSGTAGDAFKLTRFHLSTTAMKINSITVSKNRYAEKALQRLDYALSYLSNVRSAYGAKQNALGHIIGVNSATAENTQSAESRIRDTDIAKETVLLSKQNILMQSAQAILTQANQSAESVLLLLK